MNNRIIINNSTQVSPFSIIESRDVPRVTSPYFPFLFSSVLVLCVVFVYYVYIGLNSLLHQLELCGIILVLLLSALVSSRKRRESLQALEELLESLCSDLENLYESIDFYLKDNEGRANRLFYSMTSVQSAAWYLLTKIREALEHRIRKIQHFLYDEDGEKNLSIAYRYLQAPLRIREGILEKDSKNKQIPLAEIRSVADECINNIAAILRELEGGKPSTYESDLPYEDYEEDENREEDNE